MKRISKLLYSILFIVLTSIMVFTLANVLRDKETTLAAMYSEPDNSIEVAIVGSSHVNNGYIPNIIWNETGLSACNVFSWSQPMWTSYHYIKETLKTQSPDVIVLEMYGMMYGNSYIMPEEIDKTNYANSFNIDMGLNFLQLIHTAQDMGIDLKPYEDFLNLPRYHTRWKNLNSKMFTYNPHKDRDFLKGYGLTFNSNEELKNPDFKTNLISEPYEFSVEYLDKIVNLCEKENIKLIFTMTPYIYNEKEAEIFNWIENYAQEHNIPFLNYNLEDGYRIGIDYSTDLSDNAHLNYFGAVKVTEDLSNILKTYNFEKRNNGEYKAILDTDYEKYNRVISAYDVMTIENVNSYINAILKDKNYSAFIISQNNSLDDEFFKILSDNGIDLPKNKDKFTMAINVNGENVTDINTLEFNLFNKSGNIRFNFSEGDAEIILNDMEVFSKDSNFKIVLYDNILERPLETIALVDGKLTHKEFTSDIIGLFKK